MKKIFLLLIITVICIVGCSNNEDGEYKDGSYTERGDEWAYGQEEADVVIKDGQIEEVNLKRLDKEGNNVTQDYQGQEVDGRVYPDLVEAASLMEAEIINNQSTDVDSITGSTISCDNWKVAVDRALENAK